MHLFNCVIFICRYNRDNAVKQQTLELRGIIQIPWFNVNSQLIISGTKEWLRKFW